jgi:hypothetical protein
MFMKRRKHSLTQSGPTKTIGPFSVPQYADGAYAVLLTLDFFKNRRFGTFRTTPVLSFKANGLQGECLEADVAILWQEAVFGEQKDGVLFAECKTYDQFKKQDFERMRFLATKFPGAVLVFATLRKGLTSDEITGIAKLTKAGRKWWKNDRPINPVLILTGTELLGHASPPYCWDEGKKGNFADYTAS